MKTFVLHIFCNSIGDAAVAISKCIKDGTFTTPVLENLGIPGTSVSEIRGIMEMRSLALDDLFFYNIADNFKIK